MSAPSPAMDWATFAAQLRPGVIVEYRRDNTAYPPARDEVVKTYPPYATRPETVLLRPLNPWFAHVEHRQATPRLLTKVARLYAAEDADLMRERGGPL